MILLTVALTLCVLKGLALATVARRKRSEGLLGPSQATVGRDPTPVETVATVRAQREARDRAVRDQFWRDCGYPEGKPNPDGRY